MATIPVGELTPKLFSLIDQWKNDFEPLAEAVNLIRSEMTARIFGTGSSGGENAAGDKLPTKPYSRKPVYVDVRSLPNTPSAFVVVKKGQKTNTAFFPQGYAQLKQVVDRPPLELQGSLQSSFANSPVLSAGANAQITIDDSEAKKVAYLQSKEKYGLIFTLSKEEEQLFGEELTILVVDAINKKLNS
jgi:hypothetical protein